MKANLGYSYINDLKQLSHTSSIKSLTSCSKINRINFTKQHHPNVAPPSKENITILGFKNSYYLQAFTYNNIATVENATKTFSHKDKPVLRWYTNCKSLITMQIFSLADEAEAVSQWYTKLIFWYQILYLIDKAVLRLI